MGFFNKNRRRPQSPQEPAFEEPLVDEPTTEEPLFEPPIPVPPFRPESPGTIDFSQPVRTITSKQPVDILTTRARHPVYTVHAYIGNDVTVTVFTADGRLSENGPVFLENVPAKEELYLNIYPNRDAKSPQKYVITQHATRDDADVMALNRLDCIRIEFEV
jgi:hypothetical protein